ncbi:MAG: ATP-binding protein, partial [Nitrospinales bacterium]
LIGFSKSSGFPNLTEFDWVSFVQEKEENAFRPVIELRNQFVGFGIFVGIVVFLFSIFVSRSLNIPTIQNLTQVTREIGKGNLSQKVQTNLKDEIGDLAKAFNSMTTDLENSRKQLIKAKEEAEASNRAKSEFMSGMSHELRTPLNAILGFAQLFFFNSDENLNDSQKVRINEILKAGKHLLELINEVLDLSRIEAGKITLSLEAVGLQEILDEVISIILPLAEQKGIHITFPEAQDSDLTVTADRIRLKQVLLNLFSNAVKYNIEGGSVTLKAEKTKDDKVVVHITDTGIGIPQEKLNSIFEPFNRLGAENSEIEGTGIGLCITKRLIELMAGEIFVESHLGEGSRFSIELPKGKKLELLEAKHEKYSVPSLPVITGDQKYTLLYVEDNPANLLLVKQLLDNRQDIHLLTAPEAQLGIDLALSHQPDLILMDINLPGMDGVTALKRLKQNKKTSEIPIIAVSANAMESDINCAMKAGFDAYITKPLVIESFVETIQKFLIQKTIRQ